MALTIGEVFDAAAGFEVPPLHGVAVPCTLEIDLDDVETVPDPNNPNIPDTKETTMRGEGAGRLLYRPGSWHILGARIIRTPPYLSGLIDNLFDLQATDNGVGYIGGDFHDYITVTLSGPFPLVARPDWNGTATVRSHAPVSLNLSHAFASTDASVSWSTAPTYIGQFNLYETAKVKVTLGEPEVGPFLPWLVIDPDLKKLTK